jgi:AcrR family transcriptional regulator
VAAQGFDALTMRAVAARLEAVPMALYNHFATKEQLVDALLDRVLSRFEPAPPTDDWIEDLRVFARSHRRLLADHPWAVAPLFTQPNPGLSAVWIGEHVLGILERGGLSDDQAVAAFSGLIAINYGWSSFTAARDLDPSGPSHDVAATLRQLPREVFPLTADVADAMGAYGSDAHYDFVLSQFLGGLCSSAEHR